MTKQCYLLDTHALLFWDSQVSVSDEFVEFLDKQVKSGLVIPHPLQM